MRLKDIRSIAVLRANGLGDLVFSFPALEALRAAYPEARITLLGTTHHAVLLEGRPSPVDRVVPVPPSHGVNMMDGPEDPEAVERFVDAMRREAFDLVLQMHGGGRYSNPLALRLGGRITAGLRAGDAPPLDLWVPYSYWQPEIARYLEVVSLVGAAPVTLSPRLAITSRDRAEAEEVVPSTTEPLVLLNPNVGDPRRRWAAEGFAAVGDALGARGARVLLNGLASERTITTRVAAAMRAKATDLSGTLTIGGLLALAARCRVVVSNDSGPLHLAAAVGAPTVGIYWCGNLINGGVLTRAWHRPVVSWRLRCAECGTHCLYGHCDHSASFVDVTADEVINAALELFAAGDAGRSGTPLAPTAAG